ncbi:MAG: MmgE/PrpD family protein [Anaerolineales bacterium]|nr:MmgE/PrpD family protein [Anaerolineales bacterium]
MNGSDRVIQFVQQANWQTLPSEVQHQSRRCLLDALGALIAGLQAPIAQIMAGLAVTGFGGDDATLLIDGRRVSAIGAAMANGFAANALDLDDGHRLVKGHPGACLLPVLLAATEVQPAVSGREFLTALIVGYEVAIRAGLIRLALYAPMHSSGSWAGIGAAAAAGKLLGLDDHRLRHALGIAEHHAPVTPVMKAVDSPCMAKDGVGWGAMTGMAAVLMAQQGFTGIEPLFSETPEPDWIESVGKQFQLLRLYFKPYACCRWTQPAIAGALTLKRQYGLDANDILSIRVRTFGEAARLSREHPLDTDSAQYNLAYPIAAALIDGELGPRQALPPRIFDPAILRLADRVEAEVVDDYVRAFPAKTLADVEVRLRDGRVLEARGQQAVWDWPDSSPSDADLERKFQALVGPILGERTSELVELIWRFDEATDAARLIQLSRQLSGPSR